MFSPLIIVDLLSRVRACQEQVTFDEAAVTKSRAELAGWTSLLNHAEANADPTPPAEVPALSGWCDCGVPTNPVLVHGIARCEPGEPDPMPSIYPTDRGPFQPYTPGRMAAWVAEGAKK